MSDALAHLTSEYSRYETKLINFLKATPEDKLTWSPSSSSRSILELGAHCAMGTLGLVGILKGEPMQHSSTAELDTHLRQMEKDITSLDAVFAILSQGSAAYTAYVDSLDPDALNEIVSLPFGNMPLGVAASMPYEHMRGHIAQIEYVQTIFGDHEWR